MTEEIKAPENKSEEMSTIPKEVADFLVEKAKREIEDEKKNDNYKKFVEEINNRKKADTAEAKVLNTLNSDIEQILKSDEVITELAKKGETKAAFNMLYTNVKHKYELEEMKKKMEGGTLLDTDKTFSDRGASPDSQHHEDLFTKALPLNENGVIDWSKVNIEHFSEKDRQFIKSRKEMFKNKAKW
jgi:hypothetical protein